MARTEAQKLAHKKFYEANKEKWAAWSNDWKKRNWDKVLEYARRSREKNRDKILDKNKSPEARAKACIKSKEWNEKNPEKAKQVWKRYYEKLKAKGFTQEQREAARRRNREYKARLRAINPIVPKVKAYFRTKENRKESDARYRERNREKINERGKLWAKEKRKRDPESARLIGLLHENRRRAQKLSSDDGTVTPDSITDLYQRQKGLCPACKEKIFKSGKRKYHIDHVMPLTRGGPHSITNIQLLCGPCNHKKLAMHPDDWAKKHGLLFC